MFNDNRDYLLLSENAYFYKRNRKNKLPKILIKRTFKSISKKKTGNYLMRHIKEKITINGNNYEYSICVFKFENVPSLIDRNIPNWFEVKIAYIMILELDDFVVLSKKNIAGLSELQNCLEPIDYNVLPSVFIEDDTNFEQFTLQNMNIANSAMRTKSVSAINLKENFSTLGANNYILKNLRVNNNSEKTIIAVNTSRINKFGERNSIQEFIEWSIEVKNKIASYQNEENFISIFASSQNFEKNKHLLKPSSILFDVNQLIEDLDKGKIDKIVINYNKKQKEIKGKKLRLFLNGLEKFMIVNSIVQNNKTRYKIKGSLNEVYLKINKRSITILSQKLNRLRLIFRNGNTQSLTSYLNQKNDFIVGFEDLEYVYTKRKLFRDNKLLGNIKQFLKIFITHPELDNTTSEKGNIRPKNLTKFDNASIFEFVEKKFQTDFDYFICDDYTREWADHIGVDEDRICFYHSKHKDAKFSASAFQDVIGQAQKNFGNLAPNDGQFDAKRRVWKKTYLKTQINRLRNGSSIDDAIQMWKETMRSSNPKREVHVVIDFISKSTLEDRMNKLIQGTSFTEKNEAVQILWFISSFISSSFELGIDTYIHCKP